MTDPHRGNPILAELFRHNLWANLTLIDLCQTLPEAALETNVPGTYGGIRETLTHLVGAEERYLLALAGGLERPQPALEETAPDLDNLREHARQSGERFVAYAGTVDPTRCRRRSTWCRPSTTRPSTGPRSRSL